MRIAGLTLLWLGLAACGELQAPPQYWQGIEIAIETRPNPPKVGMNEVLVVATRPGRQAEYNLLVSIRAGADEEWTQSIQDGRTGIFRRALALQEPGAQTLWVRLERGKEQTVLKFPLTVLTE